ncbi:MAG: OmpA family protein [Polyangiaceae bacterium]|nr:OmpA family protein [Polyangiaceae bacterium]
MRTSLVLLLVRGLSAPGLARAGDPAGAPAEALQAKKAGLKVTIDRSRVDLAGHRLEVKLSRPADKVKLKVIGESGGVLYEGETSFSGAAADSALVVSWTPSSEEAVARIEVWGYDTEGYYAGVAITPWNVSIPHEDVKFESDSDVIRASEVPKLEASLKLIRDALAKHKELGKITLYIVGHTDTVGSAEHNMSLSRRRARAISAWFKGKGVTNPIAYEGLGESAPAVKTADEVDEPRNRRVDYILGLEPPKLPSAELSWKSP